MHSLILSEELRRLGVYGLGDGLVAGVSIGLPVIVKFGSDDLCQRIVPDVLVGKERCALAISEPYAGSDVAQIQTTARLAHHPDGRAFFLVSGVKKWITGGVFARYFSTLVRSPGGGHSLVVVDRELAGEGCVSTKQIDTSYSKAAGTAYVTIDDALVPRENVIGEEGQGFRYVARPLTVRSPLYNFYVYVTCIDSIERLMGGNVRRQRFFIGRNVRRQKERALSVLHCTVHGVCCAGTPWRTSISSGGAWCAPATACRASWWRSASAGPWCARCLARSWWSSR
jgi:hypothetical protein